MEIKQFSEMWGQNIHNRRLSQLTTKKVCDYCQANPITQNYASLTFTYNGALITMNSKSDMVFLKGEDVASDDIMRIAADNIDNIYIRKYPIDTVALATKYKFLSINKTSIVSMITNTEAHFIDNLIYRASEPKSVISTKIELSYDEHGRYTQSRQKACTGEVSDVINYAYYNNTMLMTREVIGPRGVLLKSTSLKIADNDDVIMYCEFNSDPRRTIISEFSLHDEHGRLSTIMPDGSFRYERSFNCNTDGLDLDELVQKINPQYPEMDCYKTLLAL